MTAMLNPPYAILDGHFQMGHITLSSPFERVNQDIQNSVLGFNTPAALHPLSMDLVGDQEHMFDSSLSVGGPIRIEFGMRERMLNTLC